MLAILESSNSVCFVVLAFLFDKLNIFMFGYLFEFYMRIFSLNILLLRAQSSGPLRDQEKTCYDSNHIKL